MTTIAYRDGILAADSQGTYDGLKTFQNTKIVAGENTAIGFGGNPRYFSKFRHWWLTHEKDATLHPETWVYAEPVLDCDDLLVLLIHPNFGVFFVHPDGNVEQIYEEFVSLGSGMHFATAAMAAGSSAVDAVKIAVALDLHTGGDVDAINISAPSV